MTFFGLDFKYSEVLYEEFFMLKYHGNWNFHEAYSLPTQIRRWFMGRLVKEKEMELEAKKKAQSSSSSQESFPAVQHIKRE
mgnify:FL=1